MPRKILSGGLATMLASTLAIVGVWQHAIAAVEVSEDHLRAHMEFLSSDSLEGRGTGTAGYQISAEYVVAQLKGLGISPGGEGGSYFQQVPLIEASRGGAGAFASMVVAGRETSLDFPDDFIMSPDLVRSESSVTAEMVFVGYGIVAEHRGHNDYAGLDVEGKIVVLLPGRPAAWPSEEGAHLASGREKARHAVERGAVGIVTLHTPREEKVFAYERNFQFLDVPRMRWQGPDGRVDGDYPQLRGRAYLHPRAAQKLFESAKTSLEEIFAADLNDEPIAGFTLQAQMTLSKGSKHRKLASPNVAGILRGSDPALQHEYLVYTAHLDHLGMITNSDGVAEIYPGTMDNAAGIATLLETARVLAADRESLKRSILFLAVTGEEKGLLGAGYFAAYPTVPIQSIVANINLDMPFLGFRFADVIAFGAEHSTLQDVVARAASLEDIRLLPDPMPEEAVFVRSDHYRFVQQGIPAVMLATGFTSVNPDEDGGALFMQFLKERYHQPEDNLLQPIDYGAARIFAEINANIGRAIATQETKPKWNAGDFFGETFSQ